MPKPNLDRFDDFWTICPRKVGKGAARKVWAKIDPELRPHVIGAMQDQLSYWATKEPQYIPHPATWLSQERWEDEELSQSDPKSVEVARSASKCVECGKPPLPAAIYCSEHSWCKICDQSGRSQNTKPEFLVEMGGGQSGAICPTCLRALGKVYRPKDVEKPEDFQRKAAGER